MTILERGKTAVQALPFEMGSAGLSAYQAGVFDQSTLAINLRAGNLQAYKPEDIERLLRGTRNTPGPQSLTIGAWHDTGPSTFFKMRANDRLKELLNILVYDQAQQEANQTPVNLINAYRADLVAATIKPIERLTIDVVASMFDHILNDERIFLLMRVALARLQIPMLRIALADATIFSSKQHPARQFINRVALLSLRFSRPTEPGFIRFLVVVNKELDALTVDETDASERYVKSVESIELKFFELNIASDSSTLSEAEKPTQDGQTKMGHEALHNSVREDLTQMLATHSEMEEYLREFVLQRWSLVLVECLKRHGADGKETLQYQQALKDLVWSVQPKISSKDKQTLVGMLYQLVRDVRNGLRLVVWSDFTAADQQRFFALLMASHANAIKAEAAPSPSHEEKRVQTSVSPTPHADAPETNFGAPPSTNFDTEPTTSFNENELTERLQDRNALANATPIEVLELSGLKMVGDAIAYAPPSEPTTLEQMQGEEDNDNLQLSATLEGLHMADQVEVGRWYEMKLAGRWSRVQLYWKSPKNLFYMFSSDVGGKSHSITRRALEKLCAEQSLRPADVKKVGDANPIAPKGNAPKGKGRAS